MDKQTIKAAILRNIESEIDAWLEVEPKFTDPFEYEKSLFERVLRMGKTIMVHSQGTISRDRNEKKVLTIFGKLDLQKAHILNGHKVFKITMYMQSMICMLGQHSVYKQASELLQNFLGLDVNAMQIQRVCNYYGGEIDPIINANHQEYIPQLSSPKKDDKTYVMVDGSMLMTREDKWKENKLGRIFRSSQNIDIQRDRNEIFESLYVSHLGSVKEFCPKMERHLHYVKGPKVFIADGARWIWKWVEDNYPGSTQILDYYHVVEKLQHLARLQFRDEEKKKIWLAKQKKHLLEDQVYEVIKNIKSFKSRTSEIKEEKYKVMNYFEENEDRMLYGSYKTKGLLIGSGAIEAAHRHVTQKRLKLSGQRWTIKGAQAIANLRCYSKSKAWHMIENLIRLAA